MDYGLQTTARPAVVAPSVDRRMALPFLPGLFLIATILLIVDGALPQLQMLLLNGRVLISLLPLKILVFVAMLIYAALSPRKPSEVVTAVSMTLFAYLAVDSLHLTFGSGFSFTEVISGYWVYYSVFALVFLAAVSNLRIPENRANRLIIAAFLVCAPIAIAQYATGRTLLPTESSDGSFQVGAVGFLGTDRVFSLFIFPGTLGIFCAYVAGLALSFRATGLNRLWTTGLYVASAAVCYMTLVRSCYLAFISITIGALILKFKRKSLLAPWLPALTLFAGLAVIIRNLLFPITVGAGAQDASSFIIRLQEWRYYADIAFSGSLTDFFFGRGIVQSGRMADSQAVVAIDNVFFQYPLHIGLIGLIIVIAFYLAIWLDLVKRCRRTDSALLRAVAALWAALPGLGLYSIAVPAMSTYLLLAYLTSSHGETARP